MRLSDEIEMIELPGSNAYLIRSRKNTLIDTGMPGRGRILIGELERLLARDGVLDEVLLTHHDVDHIGNLQEVQSRFHAEAYISREDLPYAMGERHRPGVKHIIEKVLRPGSPVSLLPLEQFSSSEITGIPMAGHTPGHTVFWFHGFLFTGDLFHEDGGHLTPTKRIMNWDNEQMGHTIEVLLEMDVDRLCPAHGHPVLMSDETRQELKEIRTYYAGKSRN